MSSPEPTSPSPQFSKPPARGFKRFGPSLRYSLQGLKAAWRHEEAFRMEFIVFVIALPCAWLLGRNWVEVVLLMGSLAIVLMMELLNSAIEALVDRISLDYHELSGRAKDLGSACTLVAMLLAGTIWVTLFVIRLLQFW